eukprot:1463870-Pleurochrysis_carterae.AAC.1
MVVPDRSAFEDLILASTAFLQRFEAKVLGSARIRARSSPTNSVASSVAAPHSACAIYKRLHALSIAAATTLRTEYVSHRFGSSIRGGRPHPRVRTFAPSTVCAAASKHRSPPRLRCPYGVLSHR